ncbi:MAG: GNAT family N-acetyltransferase [Gemmobacter sp.]
MTDPLHSLLADMAATWPPVAQHRAGPWVLREGGGGGSRVSAATAVGPVTPGDLAVLEEGAARLGQPALVMVRPGEEALDAVLAQAGYALQDETVLYAAPVSAFPEPPRMTAFPLWPPLAVTVQIWADAGLGPARMAVMDRAMVPRVAILGRHSDRAAGAAYVAVSGGTVFVHALTVVSALQRQGVGRHIMYAAAEWAHSVGARQIALAVTRTNAAANALYASLGMRVVGHYHYRRK